MQLMGENPMAVRTQRKGANPRAEVARSYTLASIGPGDAPGAYALTREAKEIAQATSLEGWALKYKDSFLDL